MVDSIIRDEMIQSVSYSFVNLLADWSIHTRINCCNKTITKKRREVDWRQLQRHREQRTTLVGKKYSCTCSTMYCFVEGIEVGRGWVSTLCVSSPEFCQLSLYSFECNTDLLDILYGLINPLAD